MQDRNLLNEPQCNLGFEIRCDFPWGLKRALAMKFVYLNLAKKVEFLEVVVYLVRIMEYSHGKDYVCIVLLNLAECLVPSM